MNEIEYTVSAEPEDAEVRGNAMASGDDDVDRHCEDAIIADFDGGNVWAWCCVKVTACIDGIEGTDYLGCCSYKDEDDFRKGGYFEDMKLCAAADLRAKLLGCTV